MKNIAYLLIFLFFITSCSSDDSQTDNEPINNEQNINLVLGSWTRNETLGGIDGTKTFTFNSNSTYSVQLIRIEDFNGPCSLDPYCDNDYSGDCWFTENNSLCINSDEHGWTECYDWEVDGDRIRIHGENYYR